MEPGRLVTRLRWIVAAGILVVSPALMSCSSSLSVETQQRARRGDVEFLMERLSHKNEWIVADCARGLGRHKVAQAIPELIRVLEDEAIGPHARWEAGLALAQIHPPDGAPRLRLAYQRAGHPEERYWLLLAVAAYCDDETQGLLEQVTSDSDIFLSRIALKSLNHCRKAQDGEDTQ